MHARTQLNKQFHTVTLSSQLVPQYGLHFGILTLRAQPSKKRIFINWSHSQESQRLQYTQTGAGFECVYSYTARGGGLYSAYLMTATSGAPPECVGTRAENMLLA